MLLVSQAANGSLSARRLPSKPLASRRGASPYPLFAGPRVARRRLALSGAADAPRRASASPPTRAAAARPLRLPRPRRGPRPPRRQRRPRAPRGRHPGREARPGRRPVQARLLREDGASGRRDLLCLLVFSAIRRLSHNLPVLDAETFKTADPFIAGQGNVGCSAYLLGRFGDDANGRNGVRKAVTVAAKSWAVGIPEVQVLLTAWRALASQVLSAGQSKKDDVYKKGNPFELFELLTSLVRRW
ncbi:hypothetical protein ZWY2020_011195 [Hordeum vulgare]|nr:hypothetical protein ZWY2020_011195 [Hordeum vulgare]